MGEGVRTSRHSVLPLLMVENSAFSPNRLRVLSTRFLLPSKEASLLPISSGEDSSDASGVLAPARVCPPVLSRTAVFPKLSPSWPCKGRPKPPGVARSTVCSSHAPHTIAPPVAKARAHSSVVGPVPLPVRPWREIKSRRGAPKRVNTEGFACPNRTCSSSGITDAHIPASFWRWHAWSGFAHRRPFAALPAARRSLLGATLLCPV
jgi:hypothetical protein